MNGGAGESRSSGRRTPGVRSGLLALAILLAVAVLAPPVGTLARRYAVAEALQFAVLAVLVPALVVLGAPWRMGRAGGAVWALRLADARRRHRSPARSVVLLAIYLAAVIGWRTPPAVDALVRSAPLALLEAATLVGLGVLFWLEVVVSPPMVPRSGFPVRIAVTVIAMWTTWTIGYLLGMSHTAWFTAFVHTRSSGLSLSADQQLAAGVLWVVPAMAYLPAVLVNLMSWLKDSEDADEELRQLVRAERKRSWWGPSPPSAEVARSHRGRAGGTREAH